MGREFSRAEDTAGGPAVAVLSYEFWQRALGGDTSALGRAIALRGEPYTVVGIMPRGFRTSASRGRVDSLAAIAHRGRRRDELWRDCAGETGLLLGRGRR